MKTGSPPNYVPTRRFCGNTGTLGNRGLGLLLPFAAGYLNGGIHERPRVFLLAGVLRTVLVLNSTFTINSTATWSAPSRTAHKKTAAGTAG